MPRRKSFAAYGREGGRIGGRKRFEKMSADERQLFALRNSMKRLGESKLVLWIVGVSYLGAPYTMIGASKDSEGLFRKTVKALPVEAEITLFRTREIPASKYHDAILIFRGRKKPVQWGQKPSVQIIPGEPPKNFAKGRIANGIFRDWTKERRPGRPTKKPAAR